MFLILGDISYFVSFIKLNSGFIFGVAPRKERGSLYATSKRIFGNAQNPLARAEVHTNKLYVSGRGKGDQLTIFRSFVRR